MPRFSRRELVRCGALIALLAFQIGVPMVRLFAPGQARFGWQMFSAFHHAPRVVAVGAGGALDTLDVKRYFAFRRGDLSPSAYERLPAHICHVTPEIESLVIYRSGAPPEPHRCR